MGKMVSKAEQKSDRSDLNKIGWDVLERRPRVLSPLQIEALGHLAKIREFSNAANTWRTCEIAYVLDRGAPEKTTNALNRLFKSTLGVSYQRGKERALAFKKYRRDPTEFFRYKPTAAILLASTPKAARAKIWADTGSLAKLRAHFRRAEKPLKPSKDVLPPDELSLLTPTDVLPPIELLTNGKAVRTPTGVIAYYWSGFALIQIPRNELNDETRRAGLKALLGRPVVIVDLGHETDLSGS